MNIGQDKTCFSINELRECVAEDVASSNDSLEASVTYLNRYFAHGCDGNKLFFTPAINYGGAESYETFETIDDGSMKKRVFNYVDKVTMMKGAKPSTVSLKQQFFDTCDCTLKIGSDPRETRFYTDPTSKMNFINLSPGFLHKGPLPYGQYPAHVQANVKQVLDHIKNVWNSKDEAAYDYCLKWLAHALTGHKRNTALFLNSGEGTGKSCIMEFIITHVIGYALGLITVHAGKLKAFNSQLLGKILVVLEEMPSGSSHEWASITEIIKHLITGGSLEIEKKFQDSVQVANLISLVIFTNNLQVGGKGSPLKFGKDIRRFLMCDVSHDRVDDTKYFKGLTAAMNRETGEAFFAYMLEVYEESKDTFDESVIPMTQTKELMKTRNLGDVLTFFRDHYLKAGLSLSSLTLADLAMHMTEALEKKWSIQMLSKALPNELPGIKIIAPRNAKKYIENYSHAMLKAFYIKKGYWNATYDIDEDVVGAQELIDPRDDTILRLQEEVSKLRAMLEAKPAVRKAKAKIVINLDDAEEIEEAVEPEPKPIKKIKLKLKAKAKAKAKPEPTKSKYKASNEAKQVVTALTTEPEAKIKRTPPKHKTFDAARQAARAIAESASLDDQPPNIDELLSLFK